MFNENRLAKPNVFGFRYAVDYAMFRLGVYLFVTSTVLYAIINLS
tara:strand:- start:13127 stop:13261 length:135 start_codon:yes stop_codon:yes gene_type:complete